MSQNSLEYIEEFIDDNIEQKQEDQQNTYQPYYISKSPKPMVFSEELNEDLSNKFICFREEIQQRPNSKLNQTNDYVELQGKDDIQQNDQV